MENAGYLFAAYALVWITVFGFVIALLNKQRKLGQDLKSLNASLTENGPSSDDVR